MESNNKSQCNFYCLMCKFGTNSAKIYLNHTETSKHLRNGKPKTTICNLCNYKCSNHWNLKQHYMTNHATDDERANMKLYCISCKMIFFSRLYYDKHINGIKHKNKILANECMENDKINFYFGKEVCELNKKLINDLKELNINQIY